MKQKKSEITENKNITHSYQYTGKDMTMNIISKYLKQGYQMSKR